MKDIEVLRRMAKKGISFPKQTPQPFELFGVRCIAIGFYRGEEKRLLFIAENPKPRFHNGHKIIKFSPLLESRCYELPFTGQVDLGIEQFSKGFYV